jgi:hypothetical protein
MQEKWIIWDSQIENFPDKIYLDNLTDNKDGLVLNFSNEDGDKTIKIIFEDSVMSYRNNDESYMLRTINYVSEVYGSSFMKKNSIFIVENSPYIEWFNSESYDIYKDYDLRHFVFMTPNDIVEVISTYPPKITLN